MWRGTCRTFSKNRFSFVQDGRTLTEAHGLNAIMRVVALLFPHSFVSSVAVDHEAKGAHKDHEHEKQEQLRRFPASVFGI
jgi:hypothetical protein